MSYREKEIEKLYYTVKEVSKIAGIGIKAVWERLAALRGERGSKGKRKRITFKELQKLAYQNRKQRFLELRGMNSND